MGGKNQYKEIINKQIIQTNIITKTMAKNNTQNNTNNPKKMYIDYIDEFNSIMDVEDEQDRYDKLEILAKKIAKDHNFGTAKNERKIISSFTQKHVNMILTAYDDNKIDENYKNKYVKFTGKNKTLNLQYFIDNFEKIDNIQCFRDLYIKVDKKRSDIFTILNKEIREEKAKLTEKYFLDISIKPIHTNKIISLLENASKNETNFELQCLQNAILKLININKNPKLNITNVINYCRKNIDAVGYNSKFDYLVKNVSNFELDDILKILIYECNYRIGDFSKTKIEKQKIEIENDKKMKLFGYYDALLPINIDTDDIYDRYNKCHNIDELTNFKDELLYRIKSISNGEKLNETLIEKQCRAFDNPDSFKYNDLFYTGKMHYTNKIIEEHPKTLIASVLLIGKIKERIRTLGNIRENRDWNELGKKYKETKKKYNDNPITKDRIKIVNKNAKKEWSDEKWDKYREKNKIDQQNYRDNNNESGAYEIYKEERKLEPGIRFSNVKIRCAADNIKLGINASQFKEIMYSQCELCGLNVQTVQKPYRLNYVIRIEPSLGYVVDNLISLCCDCAEARRNPIDNVNHSIKKLRDMIIYIGNNLGVFRYSKIKNCGVETYMENICKNVIPRNYNIKNNEALGRNIDFELSENEYGDLTQNNICHYCGIFYENIGIDRLYSSNDYGEKCSYSIDNVVPCCKICNYIKGKKNIDEFEKYCLRVVKNYSKK